MTDRTGIAVLGAGDLVGEETLRLLAAFGAARPEVYALDTGGAVGEPVECGDTRLVIGDAAAFDYGKVGLVLASLDHASAARCLTGALASGAVVVDNSGHLETHGGAPLVAVDANADALQRALDTGGAQVAVATPGYVTLQALRVLAPLQREYGLARVGLTVCHPAARGGQGGVESLARHSITALNGRGLHAHGGVQPFRLAPRPGEPTAADDEIVRQLRALLGNAHTELQVTELLAPVFYECTLVLDVKLGEAVDAEALEAVVAATPGLSLEASEGSWQAAHGGAHRVRPHVHAEHEQGADDGDDGVPADDESVPEEDASDDVLQVTFAWHAPQAASVGLCVRGDVVHAGVAANHARIAGLWLKRVLSA